MANWWEIAGHDELAERWALAARLKNEGLTLAEIGRRFGVSRERVRQLILRHNRFVGAKTSEGALDARH